MKTIEEKVKEIDKYDGKWEIVEVEDGYTFKDRETGKTCGEVFSQVSKIRHGASVVIRKTGSIWAETYFFAKTGKTLEGGFRWALRVSPDGLGVVLGFGEYLFVDTLQEKILPSKIDGKSVRLSGVTQLVHIDKYYLPDTSYKGIAEVEVAEQKVYLDVRAGKSVSKEEFHDATKETLDYYLSLRDKTEKTEVKTKTIDEGKGGK